MTPAVRYAAKQSALIVRAQLEGKGAVEQMADDLRIINANAGGVVAGDLELLGWDARQIERHGAAARSRAIALAAGR